MNQIKRVFTLYRVSTIGQVDKDDIPMQKECYREFIASHPDWELIRGVYEKGVSGYKKTAKERDAIIEIQRAAVQKEFDILLVYMFDRLGRRDDETPFVVEWFVRNGIEVWSTIEGQQRFDSHVDKLLNYIRYWQASGESVKTSIRVKTRLEQLTTEGLYTGGTVTYGYCLVDNGRTNKRNQPVLDFAIDEDAAEVIRLIFKMYVYDGYGAQRLCRYLAEHGIYRVDGRNFPSTSINRIIKNKMYLGIVHNGEVESEVIPELQIIDRETFDKAQQLMINRATHHSDTALNMSGRSLLVGNIYCGHCGNRLTLATSGRKRVKRDGTVIRETRFRYQCHYGVRHPGACDGQSGYSVPKVDDIVEKVVLQQFAKFRSYDGAAIIDQAHNNHIALSRAQCARLKRELTTKQKELADYQAEIIRVIRGESRFSEDMLTYLMKETQTAVEGLAARLEAVQAELAESMASEAEERKEYKKIKTWAELYRTCSFAEKKMILSRFIKAVHVYRDYRIDIEFNISFDAFKTLTVQRPAV